MTAAEVGQRHAIDHRTRQRTETAFENLDSVGARDRMHRVEAHAEATREQATDGVEVEQRLHQRGVRRHGIDDVETERTDLMRAKVVEVEVRQVGDLVFTHDARALGHFVGERLRRRATVAGVVLDAEVAIGAARIVAGRQNDAAVRTRTNQVRGRRRGEQPRAPHDHVADAVAGRHADDGLGRVAIVVAPIAADHQRGVGWERGHIEQRLHEILEIVLLLEDGGSLP